MQTGDSRPGLSGRLIGDYQVLDLVGRGGMAEVYRARDHRLGRIVALKILAPHLTYDERFRTRFVRESRTVAGMDHPYIIPIFEAGEADGLLFIAMRFVGGEDLRVRMSRQRPFPGDRATRLLGQIAAALDSAHENGLVHRDVKPANVLVAAGQSEGDEHVYLTDFGLTKSATSASGLTSQGQFVGTPRYIAPEQITGDVVDGRCDQYALGCVAYEMLCGVPPFVRENQMGLLYAHVSEEAPPASSHRPDLPGAVDGVLARAIAKSPSARYPTCLAFVRALREALGEVVSDPSLRSVPYPASGEQTPPPGLRRADTVPPSLTRLTTPSARIGGRRPVQLIGAGIAVLVAAAAAVALLLPGGSATYPGSAAAPFKFDYPASWQARTHSDVYMVASPEAAAFERLFATPVAADWTPVAGLGGSATGVYAGVSDTLDNVATAPTSLPALLPGKVSLGPGAPVTAGGAQGVRYQGSVADPADPGHRLEITVLVVPRAGASSAFLVYFCAPSHCSADTAAELVASFALNP
ncbi:serine/threonine-protein kinase [Actinocorallia sp. A-T 12471]|uniref:serine/threonine-protein kinase n=1 Tax=Actinocorallia sp. A-T 12471 TaxID=3089813 RepID=UPI0029D0ECA7|nr:serine/threonine-protein kinase [Actinocorallia sp. A-T 12471]MDX6739365.1 serine/threonine-protein kinase [Actinocorallia sp. A-T 12471]